ncbi:MAG: hypothetical protein QF432_02495 [Dehalococcoidales bacterium]|jgi:predicted amidophosphoribosyltransferase|nr:hypothetical protein [Dehalococcoidales bacterium]
MTEQKQETEGCACPYCDVKLMGPLSPFCQSCMVAISYCPDCEKPLPQDGRLCPNCGAEIKR